MTELQKTRIREMRHIGCSYKHIATTLSLLEGTVKSYCLRAARKNPDAPTESTSDTQCKHCGNPITQVAKRKRRLFCSKVCRQKWWNTHLYLVDRSSKALHHFTCPTCNKSFTAYGNPKRKFCSHDCYIRSRYYKDADDGR